MGPEWGIIKNKQIGMYIHNQSSLCTYVGPNKTFETNQKPRNSLKASNAAKKTTDGLDLHHCNAKFSPTLKLKYRTS